VNATRRCCVPIEGPIKHFLDTPGGDDGATETITVTLPSGLPDQSALFLRVVSSR